MPMCSFTSLEHVILGLYTGQNFGNLWSPSHFKLVAVAHQQWVQYLWLKEPKDNMGCAASYTKKMSLADPISKDPLVKTQKDAMNLGVLDSQGIQKPPLYSMQVNNFMFADIKEIIKKTAGLSIIFLKDISGAAQSFQEHPLSLKKWDPLYAELCLLVRQDVNSWQIVIIISKNQRLQVLCYIYKKKAGSFEPIQKKTGKYV